MSERARWRTLNLFLFGSGLLTGIERRQGGAHFCRAAHVPSRRLMPHWKGGSKEKCHFCKFTAVIGAIYTLNFCDCSEMVGSQSSFSFSASTGKREDMKTVNKKRNYVKKKQSVNDSMKMILSTLQSLNWANGSPLSEQELIMTAKHHAQSIQAMCWSRRARFSDAVFQAITRQKTVELCNTLVKNARERDGGMAAAKPDCRAVLEEKQVSPASVRTGKIVLPPIATLMELEIGGMVRCDNVFDCD